MPWMTMRSKQWYTKASRLPNSLQKVSIGPLLVVVSQPDHRTGGRWKSTQEGAVKDFRELKVWQKAHQLTLTVYQLTAAFPREELYGLTSQLRRSCSSIPANLAEGCGRNGDAEFARFCSIAMGSASEVEYHLLLAQRPEADPAQGLRGTRPARHRTETHADRALPKADR